MHPGLTACFDKNQDRYSGKAILGRESSRALLRGAMPRVPPLKSPAFPKVLNALHELWAAHKFFCQTRDNIAYTWANGTMYTPFKGSFEWLKLSF